MVNMARRLFLIFTSLAVFYGVGASELRNDAPLRPEVRAIKAAGIDNLFALSTNLFSGSAPEGDQGFAALEKLGIKTIITVDGTLPDVQRAHAHGMRYIHLPHGYDGIPRARELELIKAVETAQADGPIYMHCHHGQHRGPTAAAVVCMAEKDWSRGEAEAWLRAAGTGTIYQGLYAAVRNFQKPTTAEMQATSAKFVEAQQVSRLVDSMVAIDQTLDRIKSLRTAGASGKPDNHLLNEATLLREHLREAQRLPDAGKRGVEFLTKLAGAETQAAAFEQGLESSSESAVEQRNFTQLANSCVSCHRVYRDKPRGFAKSASPLGR
jgi:protein tyrosine phosphatase (PTP) superfamily phosphohydrolase (DUF442 family)